MMNSWVGRRGLMDNENIYHCRVWHYVQDMYRALSINSHVCAPATVQLYRRVLWSLEEGHIIRTW